MPRVLIADDDPVSLRFLSAAVSGLGCSVVAAASGAEALTAAAWATFDLLLLDRRMPDLSGAAVLTALRARHVEATAIATSAELSPAIMAELRAAGFIDAIEKPITLARLQQCLAPYLDFSAAAPSLLDDAAALAASGSDREALSALRSLFAAELATIEHECTQGPRSIQRERLHRLRASCGFCGAAALGESAQRLELALREDRVDVSALYRDFVRQCQDTRAALVAASAER